MPQKKTFTRTAAARRAGKSPSTQAGEFVREEIEHVREGKHGARSAAQAIAIGLSKARRAGVKLEPPAAGTASARTRQRAARDYQKGQARSHKVSASRSNASLRKLKRESSTAASHAALSKQARTAAKKRARVRA
jgi:hypothetical protein